MHEKHGVMLREHSSESPGCHLSSLLEVWLLSSSLKSAQALVNQSLLTKDRENDL